MSQDVRSKTGRALPPWADDINIDNADAQDNAAETAVIVHDREGSSEAQPSEDSANAGSYTRVTRMEVDADILSLFKSSLAEAIDRWRDLYSRRDRRGTNKDLSIFTCAAAALVPARADRLMVYRGLIRDDHGFFTFVEDVLSQADFFDEYPDFVTNMLDVVYNICDKAGDDPVLRSRALRLVETACRNAWERRWLLEDDKEIERRYPRARQDIRKCLRSVILHHALSPNCNPTLSLRRAGFLCWYCGTEAPAGSRPELSLPICLLHFSLLGSPIEGEDYVLPDEDTFDFIRSEVLPAFGAEKYLARLLQTLRRDDLFDTHLNRTIKVLYRSITHPDLFAQLGPSGVLGAALDAVNRQEANGKPGSQNASISSLMALYTLITELATDVPDARMAIPSLFLDGCYVNVITHAIRACAIDNYNLEGLSYVLCSASLTALRSCSRAMDRLRARNLSRKAMRRSVREDWYPTLDFLRRMRASSTSIAEHDQLLESWMRLGEDIGFEESVQKAEYERRMREALRHCAWKECQYHEKEPSVSLRSCKGCTEVRYCSRSCQRDDWKNCHQRRCKRLKEEVASNGSQAQ